ncbi:MAG: hypothetical protein ABF683_01645 [Sporolactobacillus sp.]
MMQTVYVWAVPWWAWLVMGLEVASIVVLLVLLFKLRKKNAKKTLNSVSSGKDSL